MPDINNNANIKNQINNPHIPGNLNIYGEGSKPLGKWLTKAPANAPPTSATPEIPNYKPSTKPYIIKTPPSTP